ncbi:hypothetical protein Y032_0018g3543 [Ancylostoma ceylanicum]|uniref:Uncharacterized protein n=1 Tax=Ancylostoma ceylanicum TaxID=53326 RepID=A0A016V2W1_9BILA|nr:hypothetical protein Y032_0018g3543 [Ancylostoma ceylanicum]
MDDACGFTAFQQQSRGGTRSTFSLVRAFSASLVQVPPRFFCRGVRLTFRQGLYVRDLECTVLKKIGRLRVRFLSVADAESRRDLLDALI